MSRRSRRGESQEQAPSSDLVRRLATDVEARARRKRRRERRRKTVSKFIRAGLLMMLVTFVIIPSMIAGGKLLGPLGMEGLGTTSLLLALSYALILFFTFRRRSEQQPALQARPAAAAIAQLPAQTDDWLDQQRNFLPYVAHGQLDSIATRLEAIAPQVQSLDPNQPVASELRRLLGEELPELVQSYCKVPVALRQKPLHDGPSPERQLLDGLQTIEHQIGRLHERLAADDLNALATHQRYLDLKYKPDDELK
jgi:hypothetical protein